MKYLSVCSGIEAASAAWMPLGWTPVAFSEIEPFPSSVLAHHHPEVPNWGDMTKFEEWPDEPIDLLCGGTPCQSFSVAGLRKGLADPRGNLMLTFGAIAAKYRPRWLVWENVPGVLSSNGGRDFGTFLGMLGQLGYGFAYRVLDAQYVRVESHPRAVPQRRRRVFVVGHSGGQWHRAAAVLFERASLCGHPAPSREAGQVAPTIPSRSTAGGGLGTDFDCDGGVITMANGQGGEGFDASEDGTGRGTPLVPMFLHTNKGRPDGRRSAHTEMVSVKDIVETLTTDGHAQSAVAVPVAYGIRTANTSSNGWGIQEECTHTLDCAQGVAQPVAFDTTQITSAANYSNPKPGDPCHPLAAGQHASAIAFPEFLSGTQCASSLEVSPSLGALNPTAVATQWAVRRLTPLECERLMGFPDGHTAIPHKGKPAADGPRYKALGNSWAVNCASWIGERIEQVEGIPA